MQKQHGPIFVAQSKLIAFYWKTLTFHGFGQMCLSEVLCLMMLKLGGPWHKSQQFTQLQPVSEAHAACTFVWDQQHSLFSKVTWRPVKHRFIESCLIYCIVLVSRNTDFSDGHQFHTTWKWMTWRTFEVKEMMSCHLYLISYKVWEWNCLTSGATSQDLGCLVEWRVPQLIDELDFEDLALNMESLYAKTTRTDFCCSK